jgi:hypothetical protein
MCAGLTCAGETLYNGIEPPDNRQPVYDRHPKEPMPVPYLKNPPAVIPIDVGRQLLVDDFLIEKTTLKRTFHTAEYHPSNPVPVMASSVAVDPDSQEQRILSAMVNNVKPDVLV